LQGRFIAGSINRRVDNLQGGYIAGSIHRRVNSLQVDSSWVDSSQSQFIVGSISCESIHHRGSIHCKVVLLRVDSSQGRIIAIFWVDIQNWVRFAEKTFSSLLGSTEKLVIKKIEGLILG
jgi:hypothetical protein